MHCDNKLPGRGETPGCCSPAGAAGARSHQVHDGFLTFLHQNRLVLEQEEKSRCQPVCGSTEMTESLGLCGGSAPTSCHSELSCATSCACWVSVQCPGGGDHRARGHNTQNVHNLGGKVSTWRYMALSRNESQLHLSFRFFLDFVVCLIFLLFC